MKLTDIRKLLHTIPEVGLSEHKTSRLLTDLLTGIGLDVHTGFAGTGIVANLERGRSAFRLGLRAEMDGLPINEPQDRDYASRHPGVMHACGHDGHMTMLLGAAKELAEDQSFEGTVRFIFQPAEENFGGAQRMIEDGLFERFPCDMIFGLHNMPGIPVGHFAGRSGALMASIDAARVTIKGEGGHGAQPEKTVDPILIGAHIVSSLQSIISRNISPSRSGVVTVGSFHSGTCSNIIPDQANLELSLRATDPESRQRIIRQVETICASTSQAFGGNVDIQWQLPGYPVLQNHDDAFTLASKVVRSQFGTGNMQELASPLMLSEDFSFMLEQVPGAFFFLGNGETAPLHGSTYDFNDQAIPYGVKFYTALAKYLLNLAPDKLLDI